ncbi:MAG: glutamine--fructose-6-phosphate transaminase (isomerizing), partial [Xanthomonadaceae bacterium]|nr:glutamine--fructose-6-phosphate transaminase (isomerizing) [Xanthomonadaceae bacterium]
MCGIVAAAAQRDVAALLIVGLKALEYRGYDSAGLAVLDKGVIRRVRAKGKVREMEALYLADPFPGGTGIAHTRWATHGVPSEANAHPHRAGRVAIVHNGIIENHAALRRELQARGCVFTSETDTEVMAALIDERIGQGMCLREAVLAAVRELDGAYAIAAISSDEPGRVVGARRGAPLLIGLGIGENFLGSDAQALIQVTNRMIYLDEGDVVEISRDSVQVYALDGRPVERAVHESELSTDAVERGEYRHYMQKEIFEQPRAVADTLESRIGPHGVLPNIFGIDSEVLLARTRGLHIVACGTSYHAGLVAKYWIEEFARLPVSVEVASEYRYREAVVPADTLFVAISQSGETADTLAALRESRRRGYLGTLVICNVPESSLVREADLKLMTRAGPEIGVASTKAFTTQLAALALLALELARRNGLDPLRYAALCAELQHLPSAIEGALKLEPAIVALAGEFIHHQHALFLGRGAHYPVALEGSLKLKEISYIHAEAYPAGELKHGPLALVDEDMPVVAVAPNGPLLDKLKSNLQEVRARGGRLIVFA